MAKWTGALCAMVLLAACSSSGAPWDPEDPVDPGTDEPTAADAIRLTEGQDETGSGFAGGFVYDKANDTFKVTGLPFDGSGAKDGVYAREDRVGNLGPYAVYEGPTTNADGNFAQFAHRAIYGVDPEGEVEFGIVRTGDYVSYGFGGYMLARNGKVTLPTGSGRQQYVYSGKTAGLRDFTGTTGLEYTTGDMEMTIDFNAFNNGDFTNRNAVSGEVSNRRILDINGKDITDTVVKAINSKYGTSLTTLPTLHYVVAPNVMDSAGQIQGSLNNTVGGQTFEDGKYYVVVSGTDAGKAVGVFVVSAQDPRYDNVTVRETGGFILVKK